MGTKTQFLREPPNQDFGGGLKLLRFMMTTFQPKSLITAKVVLRTNETTQPQLGIRLHAPQAVASVSLIIVWAIAVFIFLPRVWKFILNRKLTYNCRPQVPCRNCRYFQHNHYLNCAVRIHT